MPFNTEFFYKASKPYKVASVDSDFAAVQKILAKVFKKIQEKTPHFNPKDVEVYLHGSYANNTNTYFPSHLEVMVELKKTGEYDSSKGPSQNYLVYKNYFVETAYQFNPVDFSELLLETLKEELGKKVTQHEKFIVIAPTWDIKHTVEITPCFTFNYIETSDKEPEQPEDEGNTAPSQATIPSTVFKGVLLYDHGMGAHYVTFPKLHAINGNAKDVATQGNFLKITRLFKTLNKIGMRESQFNRTRGYFVQCLLYNVPHAMFSSDEVRVQLTESAARTAGAKLPEIGPSTEGAEIEAIFIKILNYLLHADIESFACQNLVWHLFGEAAEFWSYPEAYKFIRNIKNLYEDFPSSRTELV